MSKQIVDTFNLTNWLSTETAKQQLAQAGFRGANPEYAFLAFRLVAPIAFFIFTIVYVFFIAQLDYSPILKFAMAMGGAYLGIKAPEIFLANKTKKRQLMMNRAYPNMVDLLIICAESGMSIEHAVRKVSLEIGAESIDLAEELSLLAAELSYLEQRRSAFENLNTTNRHGVDQAIDDRARAIGKIRHAARRGAARARAGKPRSAHDGGGEEGGLAAADPDGADDPVLPAGAVLRDSRARGRPDQPLELRRRGRPHPAFGHPLGNAKRLPRSRKREKGLNRAFRSLSRLRERVGVRAVPYYRKMF